jgi:flagellum-specific ATP synthase
VIAEGTGSFESPSAEAPGRVPVRSLRPTADGRQSLVEARLTAAIAGASRFRASGEVVRVVGTTIEAAGINVQLGSLCWIEREPDGMVTAEVVGFKDGRITLIPFGELAGIRLGSVVRLREEQFRVPIGRALLGRVLDGFGRPIDGHGPLHATQRPMDGAPPHPLQRARIVDALSTGIRAIDGVLTAGKGQRLGIFAGSGVGKSTLLAMLARHSAADVNVIALIGERGREVQEFIDEQLGEEGLRRSVVIVATSDQPALLRLKAAFVATAIGESFRDAGDDVLFMMDSVTRLAMAQREIGLGAGEPPALRGYPPSVFSLLPRLLERTGNSDRGTMTGFFTVLVEGDDMNEPVADTVRSILDGHIVLSRALAERNHYPAIDILASISRVMPAVATTDHVHLAGALRANVAEFEGARDLIEVGAYATGSNPAVDRAIVLRPLIDRFLCQDRDDTSDVESAVRAMESIERSSGAPGAPGAGTPVGAGALGQGRALPAVAVVPPQAAGTGREAPWRAP